MDPTVVRLLTVLVSLALGIIGGIILYIVAAIIIPEKPSDNQQIIDADK